MAGDFLEIANSGTLTTTGGNTSVSGTTMGTTNYWNGLYWSNWPVATYVWPCQCHQKRPLKELMQELKDRLQEEQQEREVAKELIQELKRFTERPDDEG